MKKSYEAPRMEIVSFKTEEKICDGLFSKLFGLDFASSDDSMTQDAVFDWSQLQ